MKKLLLLLLCVTVYTTLPAQVAISYFPVQSLLAVSTNTDKLLFGDFKIETNTFASNINMEISPRINLKRAERIQYYTGLGISFNPANAYAGIPVTNGYFLDFGMRAKPFEKLRSLQLVFEISPYVNQEMQSGNLRTRLGLSWNFTRTATAPSLQ